MEIFPQVVRVEKPVVRVFTETLLKRRCLTHRKWHDQKFSDYVTGLLFADAKREATSRFLRNSNPDKHL